MPIVCARRVALLFVWVAAAALLVSGRIAGAQSSGQESSGAKPSLDYEFFKIRVEPIFVKRRTGHARCVLCHARGLGAPQYLVKLAPGSTFWTEEQSLSNFRNVSNLVISGNPMASPFAIHPLAPEAGGDSKRWHGGGRQFLSQDDPDWKIIAAWIRGQKAATP